MTDHNIHKRHPTRKIAMARRAKIVGLPPELVECPFWTVIGCPANEADLIARGLFWATGFTTDVPAWHRAVTTFRRERTLLIAVGYRPELTNSASGTHKRTKLERAGLEAKQTRHFADTGR